MEEEREDPDLTTISPSFRKDFEDDLIIDAVYQESPQKISAAHRDQQEGEEDDDEGEEEGSGEDFEFAFVLRDPEIGPPITADEIFSNGQIRPVYPVFNRDLLLDSARNGSEGKKAIRLPLRRLLIEERMEAASGSGSASSSSDLDDLEGVPPGTYCVWTPRTAPPLPDRCRKSSSTGSSLRWRIRDLVVGRSHSDGKEKFVFLEAEEKKEPSSEDKAKGLAVSVEKKKGKEENKIKEKGAKATDVDLVTVHRMYYGRSGEGRGTKGNRRSFLPYKQGIVGFFANVNGLSRTHNAF